MRQKKLKEFHKNYASILSCRDEKNPKMSTTFSKIFPKMNENSSKKMPMTLTEKNFLAEGEKKFLRREKTKSEEEKIKVKEGQRPKKGLGDFPNY